jgi:hypothetical protein
LWGTAGGYGAAESDTVHPMSTPAEPASTPAAEDAAARAAENEAAAGHTPATAQRSAEAASAAASPNLTAADHRAVAKETVAELERIGAFDPPPAASTPATGASPTAGPAAGEQAAGPGTPATEPVVIDEPPRKKTWAERFVGRR